MDSEAELLQTGHRGGRAYDTQLDKEAGLADLSKTSFCDSAIFRH